MGDWSELKKLADDAVIFAGMNGEISYAQEQFIAAANPSAVLELIAESESSNKHWENESNNVQALLAEVVRLKAENEALRKDKSEPCDGCFMAEAEDIRKDIESHKRMLLAAACDIGTIGKALKADMNADGDELLGMVIDLKAQNSRMLEWLKDIGRTPGDKGAVMGARQLLKEFGQ